MKASRNRLYPSRLQSCAKRAYFFCFSCLAAWKAAYLFSNGIGTSIMATVLQVSLTATKSGQRDPSRPGTDWLILTVVDAKALKALTSLSWMSLWRYLWPRGLVYSGIGHEVGSHSHSHISGTFLFLLPNRWLPLSGTQSRRARRIKRQSAKRVKSPFRKKFLADLCHWWFHIICPSLVLLQVFDDNIRGWICEVRIQLHLSGVQIHSDPGSFDHLHWPKTHWFWV